MSNNNNSYSNTEDLQMSSHGEKRTKTKARKKNKGELFKKLVKKTRIEIFFIINFANTKRKY